MNLREDIRRTYQLLQQTVAANPKVIRDEAFLDFLQRATPTALSTNDQDEIAWAILSSHEEWEVIFPTKLPWDREKTLGERARELTREGAEAFGRGVDEAGWLRAEILSGSRKLADEMKRRCILELRALVTAGLYYNVQLTLSDIRLGRYGAARARIGACRRCEEAGAEVAGSFLSALLITASDGEGFSCGEIWDAQAEMARYDDLNMFFGFFHPLRYRRVWLELLQKLIYRGCDHGDRLDQYADGEGARDPVVDYARRYGSELLGLDMLNLQYASREFFELMRKHDEIFLWLERFVDVAYDAPFGLGSRLMVPQTKLARSGPKNLVDFVGSESPIFVMPGDPVGKALGERLLLEFPDQRAEVEDYFELVECEEEVEEGDESAEDASTDGSEDSSCEIDDDDGVDESGEGSSEGDIRDLPAEDEGDGEDEFGDGVYMKKVELRVKVRDASACADESAEEFGIDAWISGNVVLRVVQSGKERVIGVDSQPRLGEWLLAFQEESAVAVLSSYARVARREAGPGASTGFEAWFAVNGDRSWEWREDGLPRIDELPDGLLRDLIHFLDDAFKTGRIAGLPGEYRRLDAMCGEAAGVTV